jgi:phosphate/sulfate permease
MKKNTEVNKLIISKKSKTGFIQILAGSILVILTAGCIGMMMIIAANQSMSEKIVWIFQFIQIVVQDIFISPFITMAFEFGLYKFMQKINTKKNKKLILILKKGLGHAFKAIYLPRKQNLTLTTKVRSVKKRVN